MFVRLARPVFVVVQLARPVFVVCESGVAAER